ncbi:N-acyl amino acid synthase FeeM domain-containing protein [Piscinibacter koreensis]|uniref:N-acyl amino acid synthase FeeM domain-containing protein n=1 Tax=Piscinibacter koreensis TaxID=2742824 RepID=UPI0015907D28|nr:hypothetical protein [Schlegelella koreensis]
MSIVTTASELEEAVAVRSSAYERHNAPGAAKLREAEADDSRPDVVVLIARQKLDGRAIGTIRVQPNFAEPMKFERSAPLPAHLKGRRGAELMRLGVANGTPGRMVTAALAKASYLICRKSGVEHIYVAGRRPVDAIYRSYQFDDLLDGRKVELSYAPGALHSILCLPVRDAEERWRTRNFGLYSFMVLTHHADIALDDQEIHRRLGS